jgi:DNA-directed RNA polymerase specialized sigma24 family protein
MRIEARYMAGIERQDRRGRALLARLAVDPDDETAAREFDALYYEVVWRYLRSKHRVLGQRVARYVGAAGQIAPVVLENEVDEVAHDATATALRRVRSNVEKFDPAKGSPTMWVIGNAEFAYIDVAKAIATARRSERLRFVDPSDLTEERDPSPSTEEHVIRHLSDADALADAANHVSEREWIAVRLRVTAGYSREETALAIFGDKTMKKQVDGLLERGLKKLAIAWNDRKPTRGGAGSVKFLDGADD